MRMAAMWVPPRCGRAKTGKPSVKCMCRLQLIYGYNKEHLYRKIFFGSLLYRNIFFGSLLYRKIFFGSLLYHKMCFTRTRRCFCGVCCTVGPLCRQ